MDIREKLIEILREPIFPHEMVDPIEAVADYLLDSGVTVQEWISVKDRLPEESGEYIVFGRTFGNQKPKIWICECISIGSLTGWCNSAKNPTDTHWMPLPQPPKGE